MHGVFIDRMDQINKGASAGLRIRPRHKRRQQADAYDAEKEEERRLWPTVCWAGTARPLEFAACLHPG